MLTKRTLMKLMFAGALILALTSHNPTIANAGDGCGGVVRGLSNNYNLKRGTGFLAVRSGPSSKTRMKDQLFNGERVRIFNRRGTWYEISYSRRTGWAYSKYIRNSCGY